MDYVFWDKLAKGVKGQVYVVPWSTCRPEPLRVVSGQLSGMADSKDPQVFLCFSYERG